MNYQHLLKAHGQHVSGPALAGYKTRYDDAWFETVFTALDRLHDAIIGAACGERLDSVSTVTPELMVGWLEDIIFTAQETINEIRDKRPEDVTAAGILRDKRAS